MSTGSPLYNGTQQSQQGNIYSPGTSMSQPLVGTAGHKMHPVVASAAAAGALPSTTGCPSAHANLLELDCIICELVSVDDAPKKKPQFQLSMKRRLGRDNDEEERCDECREVLPKNVQRFRCVGENRDPNKPKKDKGCKRQVCLHCADMSRTRRQYSRWNHNDSSWRASFFKCDRTTTTAFLCYYNPAFGVMSASDLDFSGEHEVHPMEVCIMSVFGFGFLPLILFADLCGMGVVMLGDTTHELYQRFGVRKPECPELFFCRWCYFARVLREADLRGYPQAIPCGADLEVRKKALPKPPAGVPRMGSELEANRALAAAAGSGWGAPSATDSNAAPQPASGFVPPTQMLY